MHHPDGSLAGLSQAMRWILTFPVIQNQKEMGTNTVELCHRFWAGTLKYVLSLSFPKRYIYTVLSYWVNKGTKIQRGLVPSTVENPGA